MPIRKAANIQYIPVVESINRKFALRREIAGFDARTGNTTIYMGGATKNFPVAAGGAFKKNYFFMKKYRSSKALSSTQIDYREWFTAATKWQSEAMKRPQVLTANMVKWNEASEDQSKTIAGVSAYGYTNIRTWMTAICVALRKDGQTLPADYALPAFDA